MLESFVPGVRASQLNGVGSTASELAVPNVITFAVLSLKVIFPSFVSVPVRMAQLDVALAVQMPVSIVPAPPVLGSLRPNVTAGVAGEFGGIVLTATYVVLGFPLVSVMLNRICHSEFGGSTVEPVLVGSNVWTRITKVRELSVQLVKGSPMLTFWIVNSPDVGSVGTVPAAPAQFTVVNGAAHGLPPSGQPPMLPMLSS